MDPKLKSIEQRYMDGLKSNFIRFVFTLFLLIYNTTLLFLIDYVAYDNVNKLAFLIVFIGLCLIFVVGSIFYVLSYIKDKTLDKFDKGINIAQCIVLTLSIILGTLYIILKLYKIDISILKMLSIAVGTIGLYSISIVRLVQKDKVFDVNKKTLSFIFIVVSAAAYLMLLTEAAKWAMILAGLITSALLTILLLQSFMVRKVNVTGFKELSLLTFVVLLDIASNIIFIYYCFWDTSDGAANVLFQTIMGVYAGLVGGLLTLGGVAWTIKHEKEVKRREEEQKLLTTCPLLSFREIDKVVYDGKNVNAEDKNPNMLVIDEDKDKKLVKNTNMMFRFVFHCNNDIPIKNIHFESIHIYPEYDNQSNMGRDYFFRKVNEDNEEVNVSFLNTNDYQAVAWLVADVEKNQIGELYNNLAVFGKFSKVFIDIVYDTVNIHNVTYKAELKFLCKTTVLVQGDSIEFKVRDYSNVSNWIVEQPHIIEKK